MHCAINIDEYYEELRLENQNTSCDDPRNHKNESGKSLQKYQEFSSIKMNEHSTPARECPSGSPRN